MEIAKEVKGKVDALFSNEATTLSKTLGIEYQKLEPDCVIATMPVNEKTKQPFGLLHGGASVALAESLASIGAWLNVDESKYAVVGIEINANHIRAMKSGTVRGTARPLHKGGKTHVWEIRIESVEGKLVCMSRCTLAVVEIERTK